MTEEGPLSIVRQAQSCHIRYATSNPYTLDRQLSVDVDEAHVGTFLQQCGVDPWSIQRACAELQHGRMAVLPIVGRRRRDRAPSLLLRQGMPPPSIRPRGARDREDTAKELAMPERGIRRTIRLGSTSHTLDLSNTDHGTDMSRI